LLAFCLFVSVAVPALGFLALLGWVFRLEVLRGFSAGAAMNPVSALCFIVLGLTLWLVRTERSNTAYVLGNVGAALVTTAGLLILLGHFLHWDYGLDRMLFPARLETEQLQHGRMAPNTAAGLIAGGLALLLLDVQSRRGFRPAQLLALGTALLGVLSLMGFAYHSLALFQIAGYVPMALNTGLCFGLLGLGVLSARPDTGLMAVLTSSTAGGAILRRLWPAAVLIPATLGALRLWGERAGLFMGDAGLAYLIVAHMLVFAGVVWWTGMWLHRADLEHRRAQRRLATQYQVAHVLSEAKSAPDALARILPAICGTLGWQAAAMWEVDKRSNSLNCVQFWRAPQTEMGDFEDMTRHASFPPGVGLPGRVWASGQPLWIADVVKEDNFPRAPEAGKAGLHGAVGFPIRRGTEVIGMVEFFSQRIEKPDDNLLQMFAAVGSQIGAFMEHLQMEQALRDSEALYHSLVDTLPISILRKDLDGRVTFGNQAYCQSMSRPLQELVGRTDFDLFPKELAAKYVADDRKVLRSGEIFNDIEAHRRPDGQRVFMHVIKGPVRDARGQIIGTQIMFWDETARKQAEERLAQTAAELERSNRELESFAYAASHDLQEPLRMVASFTQLLAQRYRDKLDADGQEFIQYAVDGAVRMQRLINDLLAFSRVGRGQPFSPTACEAALNDALSNLKLALDDAGAVITREPLPTVAADSSQLVQLFQNLLSNALKFRSREDPRIHVGARRDGAEWVFSVRDNGIGLEPRYADRIFVIFQRLHTRDEYPGTGVGLAICKKIVERHGGRIWVDSLPGKGSTFFFSLPAEREV
jgi:PAS domain S-box-containing protein